MNPFAHRIRTWAQENKLASALIVGGGLGVLFLTGAPFWWGPARRGLLLACQWGLVSHGVPGWVLAAAAPVILMAYARGALRLWHFWRPLPVAPAAPTKSAQQAHAEPIVEVIEGVQWRGTLYGGKVHRLDAHCPKCFFKIDPKENQGFRNNKTAYICDGCRDFEVQIDGSSFRVEDRVTRLIEAAWLQRQESTKVSRG